MRVFLAMGPGDIVVDHDRQAAGTSGRGETSITFSSQAVRLLRARGHSALLVSSHARQDSFRDGDIESRNLPKPFAGRGGLGFHLSQILYALRLAREARRFRADLAIIDSGTTHWFMLSAFSVLGIPVAANFHNVRWPHGFEPKGHVARLIRAMDSRFFRRRAVAVMGCSPECAAQARADGADALPFFPWTAQFSAAGFEPDRLPSAAEPFRLVFAGRVERSKGVFDLVTIAQALAAKDGVRVHVDICGDGGALEPLRQAVKDAGLSGVIDVRGRLERPALLAAYADSHAVIVPTRGDFCEGMPLVCAEAMLAGRPVITSVLSNALPVIGESIEAAQPQSVPSYVAAIERLAGDPAHWQSLRAATATCRVQFLDRSRSYAASMDALLASVSGKPVDALDYASLF
jgi:glycosyltransferase involved in cell wall biosynthesis